MRKAISVLAMLALLVGLFVACGSDGSNDSNQTSMDIPDWFLNPPQAEDAIYGLGSAKMKDVSRSREAAIARARQDIAFQVNARVEAMIIDYYQEAGVDDNAQAIKFYETISKQIAAIDLSNATTKQVYMAKDGTCYAMVEFSKNKMMDQVGQVFERNEDAAFAEFKADQALERLDHDLAEEPLQSSAGQ